MAMIGLGVGIDYALFIVTRYRQGLGEGLGPRDAVVRAMSPAVEFEPGSGPATAHDHAKIGNAADTIRT
jgi:uncharacterized membrane protein YdfJ with MMPL/SSD domain